MLRSAAAAASAVVVVAAAATAAAAAAETVVAGAEEDDDQDQDPEPVIIAAITEHVVSFLRIRFFRPAHPAVRMWAVSGNAALFTRSGHLMHSRELRLLSALPTKEFRYGKTSG